MFDIETIEYAGNPMIKGEDGLWYRFFDDGIIHDVEKDKDGNHDNDIIHYKNGKKARRKDLRRFSVNNNIYINNDVYLNKGKITVKKHWTIGEIIVVILGSEANIDNNIIDYINNYSLTEGK